jgi:hypothetical protein
LLERIYGCDINPFPAHLATLNLAARNIANEENYPRIARLNFFRVAPGETFCELPRASTVYEGRRDREKIVLPELDAIIGNPPYVRQEQIPKAVDLRRALRDQSKEYISEVAETAFPGIDLSRQSDLHVYFWPVAAQFLNNWFGFLTSSSWLDARYGFALQRWILTHFRIVAVIESIHEPWFEDARVKTAATILQRCYDPNQRDKNLVRFVRLKRPLIEILGNREDEEQRQEAAEELRDLILKRKTDHSNDQLRIMVKRQSDLWGEGLSVAQMFARQKVLAKEEIQSAEDEEVEEKPKARPAEQRNMQSVGMYAVDYGGGKWGRYLRAPDFYFEIMREFGARFTRIGDIATIKFGIKSGCDAFFMPRNVSKDLLVENKSEMEWLHLPLMRRCKRAEVESGEVMIVQCGDKTLHPIESRYVRPEIHSPMQIQTAIVTPAQTNRVVLWVDQPLKGLKDTHVHDFITWGSKQTFASRKSKSVPIPQRPTCASRQLWYDVTGLQPGIGFWPMTQKYRHIIAWNPYLLPGNHRLFDIHPTGLEAGEASALMAILNSTLVGLFKHFYGRYAGSEGTLDTEIVDVLMIEIPSPVSASSDLRRRLTRALEAISQREVTHLVEQEFLDCHTEEDLRELQKTPLGLPLELQREDRRGLDLLVFELLGVASAKRREQ